jgi:hypothetical protein
MFSNKKQLIVFVIIFTLFLTIDPIYAGPGGYIAKGLFKSFWGKLILSVLVIIFLPLIIYIKSVEFFKIRKNKKILQKLSLKKKEFNWLQLEKEFSNCIRRVYVAWANENMSEVKEYVNHWYWQNQQQVFLEQWKRENLKNVSRLKALEKISPLYLELTDNDNFEGTRIALSIDVEVEDYLMERDSQKIVQGKKGFQDLEYVWIFEYTEGKWLLDEIREGSLSLQFAKLDNVIPDSLINTVTN